MKRDTGRFAGLVLVTLLIGLLDYTTGDELDLFVLYFVPIAWAAWILDRGAAIMLSVLSAAFWFSANVYLGHAYTQPALGLWGGLVMFATFLATALATSRIRYLLKLQRGLNDQLSMALARVKKLSGRLPICLSCKSVEDETGRWQEIEEYFTHQSEDDFVFKQTICPRCRVPHLDAAKHEAPQVHAA